jgi:hypothetical protein
MERRSRGTLGFAVLLVVMLSMPAVVLAKGPPTGPKGLDGALAGYVYSAETGAPLSNAVIMVEGLLDQRGYPVDALTYPDGYYELLDMPVGVYTVKVGAGGYEIVRIFNVSVERGEWTWLNVELRVCGLITGFVMDQSTGSPIQGAFVYLPEGNEYNTFNTTEDGGFTVSRVLPGIYTLVIEADGHPQYVYPEPVQVFASKVTALWYILIP